MKFNINYFATLALAGSMSLVGCNDLDTFPQDNFVTADQKAEAVSGNPELASAGVLGINSVATAFGSVYGSDYHNDIGWPAVMLFLDNIGPEMVGFDIGYNWFATSGDYNYGTVNNYMNNNGWYLGYKEIRAANDVIKNIDPETTNPELQLYAAQGYANRAFMYFNLAQLFQYTYKGHESLPCVPIITDVNADEAAANGIARATVEEVYAQVLADLDKAIKNLTECGLGVDRIVDQGSKRFVSLGAAYGIRARVNLVMNKWQDAASDAAKAIEVSGATPLSIAEASVPGFVDIEAHNWLWGIYIQEIDRVVTTGICNWPSHMGSLNYGYASVGSWRKISEALYADIPVSDCRKGWFLDEDAQSKNLNANQKAYVAKYGMPGYTQVKFAPYQGVLGTQTNASDIPLLRIEEMYLIQAEATAMGGNPTEGKNLLETFVKTYRDANFTSLATTAEEVQEEIWFQRRIEFYGEGLAYYDLLRLNKGLDRRGAGFEPQWVYNVEAPLKPFLIPQKEVEANKLLGANNEIWVRPTPVADI